MADAIWLSDIYTEDHLIKGYKSADTEGPASRESVAGGLNAQGDVVKPEWVPSAVRPDGPKHRKLTEVNLCYSFFLLVGPKVHAVLETMNLGHGYTKPVAVLHHDGTPDPERQMWFWNFGNKIDGFLPEQSLRVKRASPGQTGLETWFSPDLIRDDEIAVRASCLDGPDVWVDTRLRRSVFFSGRLVSAFKNAGVDKPFKFTRCRVV